MTVTGGWALPKEDMDRVMHDAELYAEEDRICRDSAEARNKADTHVYTTEKFPADNGDKVPDDVKTEVNAAVGDVKKALEADDIDAIKRSAEQLATVSQKMGQAMYAGAQAAGEGAPTDGADATSGDDDVVDAEIVDEDGSNG